jgi:hypothetical protein
MNNRHEEIRREVIITAEAEAAVRSAARDD